MKLKEVLDNKILSLNEQNYLALKSKVDAGKVTWILGAGISVPAGLPQWGDLLAKMWARLAEIDSGDNAKVEKAFMEARQERLKQVKNYSGFHEKVKLAYMGNYKNVFDGINVLESAEYMWNYIDNLVGSDIDTETKKKLKKRVLKALIRDSLITSADRTELIKRLSNEAIGNLAKLLAVKTGRIITYNYDNILEMCLQEITHLTEKEVSVICDCDSEKGDEEGKINIHHPHGALKIVDTALGKESRDIILTESSYYEMEQRVYNWENSVQAKALVETNCIFIGFSGEDYNFRRIIKNVSPEREEPKHYIFICLNDLINKVYENDLTRCGKEEFIYDGLQLINRLYAQYSYWKRHGIIPIWSTFEELPEMISKLM